MIDEKEKALFNRLCIEAIDYWGDIGKLENILLATNTLPDKHTTVSMLRITLNKRISVLKSTE